MTPPVEVAIIGAGPYGLSLAAHLQGRNISHRIFGPPMHTWLTEMPVGMNLKSPGFATTLFDPADNFHIRRYCKEMEIPYADTGSRINLATFTSYGLEFQKRVVPYLDTRLVVSVDRNSDGFALTLEDGEIVTARKVVLAVGISHFAYLPPVLAGLSREFVTHSREHHMLDKFRGKDVIVVGAGSSAMDLAALLHEAGANVQLTARRPVIHFLDPPPPDAARSSWDRFRRPITGLGSGWRSMLCAHAPLVFHRMPLKFRSLIVRRFLGPAPGVWHKELIVGKVPLHLHFEIKDAAVENGRVTLTMEGADGTSRKLSADHVIAATGYRPDLERLDFLKPELREQIRLEEGAPVLSSNFESSLRGVYFVGLAAALRFGPLLRFAIGAGFASRRISAHLARKESRKARVGISMSALTAQRVGENAQP